MAYCINWIFDKTSNVFYRRVPRIASNILRNFSHPWEFIFTCFQGLRLLETLAFYTKHEFSAISYLHPTLLTVEWSLGYFLCISSDKYFFWIDQHAWYIISGPRNRGKFGDIHTNIHIYKHPRNLKSFWLVAQGTQAVTCAAWNSLLLRSNETRFTCNKSLRSNVEFYTQIVRIDMRKRGKWKSHSADF